MPVLLRLLEVLFAFYSLGLLVYAFLTWFGGDPQVEALRKKLAPYYEPLLKPLRNVIKPMNIGEKMIDLTPVVLLVGLWVIVNVVLYVLFGHTL
jgi:uncharacterized protein YggT (Ycf19 family)